MMMMEDETRSNTDDKNNDTAKSNIDVEGEESREKNEPKQERDEIEGGNESKDGYTDGDEEGNNNVDNDNDSDNEVVDSSSMSILALLRANPPPDELPEGWFLRRCHSQPGYVYYYNQHSGECRWEAPFSPPLRRGTANANPTDAAPSASTTPVTPSLQQLSSGLAETLNKLSQQLQPQQQSSTSHSMPSTSDGTNVSPSSAPSSVPAVKSILKNKYSSNTSSSVVRGDDEDSPSSSTKHHHHHRKKRTRDHDTESTTSSSSSSKRNKSSLETPTQVRVLHILKKHRQSRRPASWRSPKITISKNGAIAELQELLSILEESAGDFKELRATFEELARTESDCSSAKRGGDVGFFGRKKMQPAFEKASFALNIGELSGIVETSSGVHVILRLG